MSLKGCILVLLMFIVITNITYYFASKILQHQAHREPFTSLVPLNSLNLSKSFDGNKNLKGNGETIQNEIHDAMSNYVQSGRTPVNNRSFADSSTTVLANETKEDFYEQHQNLYYRSAANHFHPSKYRNERTILLFRAQEIVVAVAACGREKEALNMIKSAIVFSQSPLKIIIFTEDQYVQIFKVTFEQWKVWTNNSFTFELYKVTFPQSEDAGEWKRLVIRCASQRLFFPNFLQDVDALIFVDTDILFMSPVEETWNNFKLMNSSQEVAASHEGYYPPIANIGPYINHPFYGGGGINAGVMLMNLKRMRASNWTRTILGYYHEYKPHLSSGDQDLVDIYMYFHRDRVMVMAIRYNFRPYFCNLFHEILGMKDLLEWGVAVLHGTGSKFYVQRPIYKAIYNCWTEFTVGDDPYVNLYQSMRYYLNTSQFSKCKEMWPTFLIGMKALNTI